jgi:hypothetical protein
VLDLETRNHDTLGHLAVQHALADMTVDSAIRVHELLGMAIAVASEATHHQPGLWPTGALRACRVGLLAALALWLTPAHAAEFDAPEQATICEHLGSHYLSDELVVTVGGKELFSCPGLADVKAPGAHDRVFLAFDDRDHVRWWRDNNPSDWSKYGDTDADEAD